jgi:hypothetical protein
MAENLLFGCSPALSFHCESLRILAVDLATDALAAAK